MKPPSHDAVGECRVCIHARPVAHPRGGDSYWRCGKSDSDPRFRKFPPLPVWQCPGFEEAAPTQEKEPHGN